MFHTLLRANNFFEAFVQGVIQFTVLAAVFSLFIFLFRKKKTLSSSEASKEKVVFKSTDATMEIENKKTLESEKMTYQYFFDLSLNKGYKRMISAGGFVLPIFITLITFLSTTETSYHDGEAITDYDIGLLIIVFFASFVTYWLIYGLIVWIVKGFQEDKRRI